MRKLRFGRTELEVSAVSLGTWAYGGPNMAGPVQVGWTGHDDDLARSAMRASHAVGIRHWDTADVYGDGRSEQLIGQMWSDIPREDIVLATKVGWDQGGHGHWYHPELVRARMERSLRNLQTDHVDIYYLHHCDFGEGDAYFDDALAEVVRFKEEGKVRFIGLSDWSADKLMRFVDRVNPDCVQPYRNVVDDAYESSGLKAWVDANDVGVAFFSPLRHGLLLGKYDAPTTFPDGDFRNNVEAFRDADAVAAMKDHADAVASRLAGHREPVLDGLVGAVLSDAPTACALVGLRNPGQVAAASQVGEPLDAATAAWMFRLYGGH